LLALAVLFLLFIAVHFAAIAGLRCVVEEQLHPALPKGTRIEGVELGILSGLLEVSGFELRNDDELRIAAGRPIVDVGIWPLVSGKVRIDRLDLEDVYLRVDRHEDGSFDLGLPRCRSRLSTSSTAAMRTGRVSASARSSSTACRPASSATGPASGATRPAGRRPRKPAGRRLDRRQ
jgi:hypothetical protein